MKKKHAYRPLLKYVRCFALVCVFSQSVVVKSFSHFNDMEQQVSVCLSWLRSEFWEISRALEIGIIDLDSRQQCLQIWTLPLDDVIIVAHSYIGTQLPALGKHIATMFYNFKKSFTII